MAVVTNIDADHMDNFTTTAWKNLSRLLSIFASAAILWPCRTCVDDANVRSILPQVKRPVTTYGFAADAQVRAENAVPDGQCMRFDAVCEWRDAS